MADRKPRNPIFVAAEKWFTANPGKTLADYRKATGYNGPALKRRNKAGEPITVSFKGQGSYSAETRRKESLTAQDIIYKQTWLDAGYSIEVAEQKLREAKAKGKPLERQVKKLNQTRGAFSFSVGHLTAAGEGGGDFDRNRRLEIGKGIGGNFSRSNQDEIPDSVKPALGIPRSGRGGRDAALMDMDPELFDLGLTPQDKQKIRANPAQANDIIQQRQNSIEARRRRNRLKPTRGSIRFAGASEVLSSMQSSGSDIVDRVNERMHLTAPHLADLGFELF